MRLPDDAAARASWLGAAVLIAQQVLAKTLRDALFLAHHPAERLPLAFAISAAASVALALAFGRALERRGTRALMPAAWALYGLVLGAAGALGARDPAAAFALYVLVSAGGVALASGFWLQVTEALDPRSARLGIAGIGSAAALGGLAAGGVAWALRGAGAGALVPLTALLVAGGAIVSLRLAPAGGRAAEPAPAAPDGRGALARVFGSDLLRGAALLLTAVSAAATLLDWRFKAEVAGRFDGAERVGVFAAFHGVTSALVFVTQAAAAGPLLERAGVGRTLAVLPGGLLVASLAAAVAPGALAATAARAVEVMLRGSLFRSAWELLFTPLEPAERRATKGLLDVGFDRLGDLVGAAIAGLLLFAGTSVERAAMGAAAVLAGLGLGLAPGIERGYRRALAEGLRRGVVAEDPARAPDRSLLATLALSATDLGVDLRAWREGSRSGHAAAPDSTPEESRSVLLRSGDPMRVRFALASGAPLEDRHAPDLVPLLARDDVAAHAMRALRDLAPRVTGVMARALLDPATPDAARRRLARVIASGEPAAAAAALTGALEDERFEVRLAAGRALLRVHERHPGLALDTPRLIASVLAEAARGRRVWNAARDLEPGPADSDEAPFGDLVRDRTSRGLEHCFTLLALMLPGEPLRIAWRALHTGDPMLRGTALEYLDGALPPVVREALWPHLEVERAAPRPARSRDLVMDDLLRASPSVELELNALRDAEQSGRKD